MNGICAFRPSIVGISTVGWYLYPAASCQFNRHSKLSTSARLLSSDAPRSRYQFTKKVTNRAPRRTGRQTGVWNHMVSPRGSWGTGALHPTMLKKFAMLEDSLRLYGYPTLRIGALVFAVGGIGIYIFREYIREKAADEVSSVAYKSLGDENVKVRAGELANALIQAIMNDVSTREKSATFLKEVFTREQTTTAAANLLIKVTSDPDTGPKLIGLLKRVLGTALDDPQFRSNLSRNIRLLIQDPKIKDAVLELVKYTLQNDNVNEESKKYLHKIITSSRVKEGAINLGKQVVKGVVEDPLVQKQAGAAAWGALSYSVTPKLFLKAPSNTCTSPNADTNDDTKDQ